MQKQNIPFRDDSSSVTSAATSTRSSALSVPAKRKSAQAASTRRGPDIAISEATRKPLAAVADEEDYDDDLEPLPLEASLNFLGKREEAVDEASSDPDPREDDEFLGYERVKRRRC